MTIPNEIALPTHTRCWTNDGSPAPDWVAANMAGEMLPNGAFLIATPIGSARVHAGNVVIEHRGQLWSRLPHEVTNLIAELDAEIVEDVTAIGPGKSAQFGTKSKANRKKVRGGERTMAFRPPIGSMPSIEWST